MPAPADAADALQETNRTLWEKRSEFEPGSNFIAWAFQIARYKVQQAQRNRPVKTLAFDAALFEQLAERAQESLGLADVRLDALRACLSHLNEKERRLIQRRYAPGVAAQQVADEIGRPVHWVHTAVSRIRKRLFRCITDRLSQEGWS
jgi:RNA polymerase sigma-70 factor (ECF subfamily)